MDHAQVVLHHVNRVHLVLRVARLAHGARVDVVELAVLRPDEELLVQAVLVPLLLHHHVSVFVFLVHLGMRHRGAKAIRVPVFASALA